MVGTALVKMKMSYSIRSSLHAITEDKNCDCSVLSRNQVKLGINSNDKNIQIMSNLCDPFAFAHVAIHVVVLDNFIMTALVISR